MHLKILRVTNYISKIFYIYYFINYLWFVALHIFLILRDHDHIKALFLQAVSSQELCFGIVLNELQQQQKSNKARRRQTHLNTENLKVISLSLSHTHAKTNTQQLDLKFLVNDFYIYENLRLVLDDGGVVLSVENFQRL